MKKIVALVLALVMVLGLATVASAATTTYENMFAKNANTLVTGSDVDITVVPAKAVTYDKTTGYATDKGNVEYVTVTEQGVSWGGTYVFVNTLAEADFVLYKDAAMKQVAFYLAEIESPFYYEGVAFANFGEKCGQTVYVADEDLAYYTIKNADSFGVWEEDVAATTEFLMVGGELVGVKFVANNKVAHTPVFETKNGKVVSVECGVCGVAAVKAANKMSVPTGAVDFTTADGAIWYWGTAAAVEGETVESAKTFDAGIAMYVGMSVMAAAGSAVVLKKKD